MHLYVVTITLLLGLFLGTKSEGNGTALEEAHLAVTKACNDFSTALYKAVSSEPGNVVMSPFSVESVMTLVWMGATGETANELSRGLHLPENRDHVEIGFKYLLSILESSETITLDIANKIYLQDGFKLKAPFRRIAVNSFRSDAEEVNFVNATEEARTSINKWVEQKTHDKIKDLIAPGSLTVDTRMLALNAIYFRGGWLKPFNETDTYFEPFYTSPGKSINVAMMHQTEYFYHGEIPELQVQVLKLYYRATKDDESYEDSPKSMLLLIPDAVDGLAALEAKIVHFNVSQIFNYLSKKEIILSLPKFKVGSTLKLVDSLKQLGISKVFGRGAELSGITDEPVYITDVVQKAFIEVTEKGTEAAAATFIELVNFLGSSPTELKVNRPFLFLVMDEPSNTVLFMGRVVHPEIS
ncbi:serine protease inhibitor 42Dd [Anabrus simplex]|uniref:serine protease inhibitor 42Dd n=1 Tax=Anabrus simplex TaxID=316456 RepID=UPI0035A29BD5